MILLLKKQIYQKDCILRAIDAYCEIASVLLCENETDWICDFIWTKYEQNLTIKEFENYVIGLEG